ncbi:MAG TPA: MMPL family transporter, partial [candidate division Zixibacteria bacterium]|nr:MMPL family transporter [candidate division Zixibacteria bacterium]
FAHDVSVAIQEALNDIGGFPTPHIAGLPVAEETFGAEMFKQMAISAPMAGALIFVLLIIFFRKLKVTAAPMYVALMTVSITMGSLIAAGFTVHIMSSMIAIFLMPIAVLNSVHILSEFHDRYQKSRTQRDAIVSTMDELYKPMVFTSLTTVVGFGSLMLADIPPVRVFGGFVALGVAVAWLLSVTFNPAYAVLLSRKSLSNFGRADESAGALGKWLPRLGAWSIKRRAYVAVFSALALAIAAAGIMKIEVNDNPARWFKYNHPIRVAERQLKDHLAGTYMAYLRFDATDTESGLARTPEALKYMQRLQDRLAVIENVGSTTGVTDIVKKVRFELHDGDSAKYSIPDSEPEIAQELFLYEISGGDPEDLYKFITPDGDKALLWLQLREGDNKAVAAVVAAADEFINDNPPPPGMRFDWAGLSYINIIWQNKMVTGMLEALLGSVIIVTLMMIFLLRSVITGLISMAPLSLTIAVVYAAVGYSGKYYDMPIAVLSSLTLGLSIDFAIHFLKRGQEISRRTRGTGETLDILFGEPARAITRNIIVIALGFTPLLFSALVPYVTVGSFFLAIMGLSGVATLIILPALMRFRGERAFSRWGDKPQALAQAETTMQQITEETQR